MSRLRCYGGNGRRSTLVARSPNIGRDNVTAGSGTCELERTLAPILTR